MIKLISIIVFFITAHCSITSQIPNYTVMDTNSVESTLHEFVDNDRHTLVAFWAEWCAPCKWEFNSWKEYTNDWIENKDINLIAISIDDVENQENAVLLWNENEWQGQLLFSNLSSTLPKYFLYDKEQTLIVEKTGFTNGDEIVLDSIINNLTSTSIIQEQERDEIEIWMESKRLNILNKDVKVDLKLEVFSIEGKLYKSELISFDQDVPIQINFDTLEGMYFIVLSGEGKSLTRSIYIK